MIPIQCRRSRFPNMLYSEVLYRCARLQATKGLFPGYSSLEGSLLRGDWPLKGYTRSELRTLFECDTVPYRVEVQKIPLRKYLVEQRRTMN